MTKISILIVWGLNMGMVVQEFSSPINCQMAASAVLHKDSNLKAVCVYK